MCSYIYLKIDGTGFLSILIKIPNYVSSFIQGIAFVFFFNHYYRNDKAEWNLKNYPNAPTPLDMTILKPERGLFMLFFKTSEEAYSH